MANVADFVFQTGGHCAQRDILPSNNGMTVTTPCLLLRTGLCHTPTYLWGLTDQILYLPAVSSPPSLDLGLFHGVGSRDVMLHVVCLVTVDIHNL